jgi:DNA (cytosine-5)-methyltransferase 1
MGAMTSATATYRLIDLFAGAGGLSLGFSRQFGNPFRSVWANDFNQAAADSYNANFGPHCTSGDILALLEDAAVVIPSADLVMGGPPCQGFSLLNKNRENDARRDMWRPFMEVVARAGADIFLIENVPQLLGSAEHEAILAHAAGMGFQTASAKLCAADYGVAQSRQRAFILGCRFADPHRFFPPPPTHAKPEQNDNGKGKGNGFVRSLFGDHDSRNLPAWRTVRQVIGELPPPVGTEIREATPPLDLHFGRTPTAKSVLRYQAIPEEGMNRFDLERAAPELTPDCWIRKRSGGTDLFGRLWWDRPAFTIRTEFFKPEKGRYLHPEQHRPITHREAARLQSFPDHFRFCGSKIEIARQIGNAVPPLLAAALARSVTSLLAYRAANWKSAADRQNALRRIDRVPPRRMPTLHP